MKTYTEDRTIPDLNLAQQTEAKPFESSTSLETENFTCFGITPINTHALALKVIFSNGSQILVQYSRVLSPITYNGSNELALNTSTLRLEITGRDLAPLFDYLGEQRLAWIKSSDLDSFSDSIMMRSGEPDIQGIQLKNTTKTSGAAK